MSRILKNYKMHSEILNNSQKFTKDIYKLFLSVLSTIWDVSLVKMGSVTLLVPMSELLSSEATLITVHVPSCTFFLAYASASDRCESCEWSLSSTRKPGCPLR